MTRSLKMMTQRDREQWLRGKGGRQEAGPVIALQSEEVNMEELAAWTFFLFFVSFPFPFFLVSILLLFVISAL